MDITRIFIFDPCFGGMTGHWENYCKRLYQEILKRGYRVKVFGQTTFKKEIVETLNFEPFFNHLPFVDASDVFQLNHQVSSFEADLRKLDSTHFNENDLLIFHSIYPSNFLAITNWLLELSKKKSILSAIFFQFPPAGFKEKFKFSCNQKLREFKWIKSWIKSLDDVEWQDTKYTRYYQLAHETLQQLLKPHQHLLFASTQTLCQNFSTLLRSPVQLLPMPGSIMKDITQATRSDNTTIKIGYFGHSSFAKGGQFLQSIVENCEKKFPNVQFILHINPNDETEPHLKIFNTKNYPHVTCHFGHLSQETISRLMQEVDIILMPYSPEKYASTPSAIFNEGMSLRKIFVLPENTWAHREAKHYQAGFVAFRKQSLKNILKSLYKTIKNFNLLKDLSFTAGANFYRTNNMSNYMNIVFSAFDSPSQQITST